MAIFIPVGQTGDYHGSPGELMVYDSFKKLPDEYYVFYSVKWGKQNRGYYQKGEADFLLFDPSRGFLVVEVKGGGIRRDDDGQWFSIDHDGNEYALRYPPLDQAWRNVDRFADLLSESEEQIICNYKLIPTVWFPNIKGPDIEGTLPSEYQKSNTFSEYDLENPEAAINRAFAGSGITSTLFEKVPKRILEEVINTFAPTFRIIPGLSSELKEKDFLFNQLTNEQATLLDYLGEQHLAGIQGVSGTGKTMIALECARRLPKESSVLFLCFNKFLLKYLNDNFAEELPNVTFASLYKLYAQVHGSDVADTEEISDFLLGEFDKLGEYDHIIIDEGQDFDADHLDFLFNKIRSSGGYFYVFYDKNQLVHKWDQKTLEWLNKLDCRLVLNKNCRNTFEIAKASYAAVGIENVVLAQDINGDTPCLNNYSSIERAIEGIAETIHFYITEKGFTRKQITILTVKTLEKTVLAGYDSVGGYRLSNELDGDGILFTTARKFKGLESDVVIIIDIDADMFKDDNAKSVFYVASSRAKHCLTYIAALDNDDLRKMITDLDGEPIGDLRQTIKNLLKIDFQQID